MIQRKKKPCIKCGKQKYIFSRGRCEECAKRDRIKETFQWRIERSKKDVEFYKEVWNERAHTCENCGCGIGEPQLYNFHHLLEKSNYPHLRYVKANIAVVCWNCHNQYHIFPDKAPELVRRALELKSKLLN